MRQVSEPPTPPRDRQTKGPACTMAFRVSMVLLWKASRKRGGKSSEGSSSREEMAEASSLSRLDPVESRSLGGVVTLTLTLL